MANVQDRGPPSAAAIVIGTALISGVTGYFLGQAGSIGLFGKSSTRSGAVARLGQGDDESITGDVTSDGEGSASEEDEDSDLQDLGELKTFPDNNEECKLVLVVRTDLGMGKGMFAYSYQSRFSGGESLNSLLCQHLLPLGSPLIPAYRKKPFVILRLLIPQQARSLPNVHMPRSPATR